MTPRKGMNVLDTRTGESGKVVATVSWDRFYYRVEFPENTQRFQLGDNDSHLAIGSRAIREATR